MVPMRAGGNDEALEIGEDLLHGLALLGSGGRQRVSQFARFDAREDGKEFHHFEEVGYPVDGLVAMYAEFFGGHTFSVGGAEWE